MASEDVLKRANEFRPEWGDRGDMVDLIVDLAAEVRELRSLLSVAESGRKAERNLRVNAEEECGKLQRDKARLAALCEWVSERDCEFTVEELLMFADEELAAMTNKE